MLFAYILNYSLPSSNQSSSRLTSDCCSSSSSRMPKTESDSTMRLKGVSQCSKADICQDVCSSSGGKVSSDVFVRCVAYPWPGLTVHTHVRDWHKILEVLKIFVYLLHDSIPPCSVPAGFCDLAISQFTQIQGFPTVAITGCNFGTTIFLQNKRISWNFCIICD